MGNERLRGPEALTHLYFRDVALDEDRAVSTLNKITTTTIRRNCTNLLNAAGRLQMDSTAFDNLTTGIQTPQELYGAGGLSYSEPQIRVMYHGASLRSILKRSMKEMEKTDEEGPQARTRGPLTVGKILDILRIIDPKVASFDDGVRIFADVVRTESEETGMYPYLLGALIDEAKNPRGVHTFYDQILADPEGIEQLEQSYLKYAAKKDRDEFLWGKDQYNRSLVKQDEVDPTIEKFGVEALRTKSFENVVLPKDGACIVLRHSAAKALRDNVDFIVESGVSVAPGDKEIIENILAGRDEVESMIECSGLSASVEEIDLIYGKMGEFTYKEVFNHIISNIYKGTKREIDKRNSWPVCIGFTLDLFRMIDPDVASFDDAVKILIEYMRDKSSDISPFLLGAMIDETVHRRGTPEFKVDLLADRVGAEQIKDSYMRHATPEEKMDFKIGEMHARYGKQIKSDAEKFKTSMN